MELDALDRIEAVPHGHDLAVVGSRAQFELLRERSAVNRERMVAPGRHGIRKTFEDRAAIVSDETRRPVEDPHRMPDLPAVSSPDPLVAQANAYRRGRAAQLLDASAVHTEGRRVCRVTLPAGTYDRL